MATRTSVVLVAAAAAVLPPSANAQTWLIQSGFTARGEYNDNYFFTPNGQQQSAFTASVSPFVTAARRTETTDVTALLAVGANKVWLWGPSESTDYLSGRLGLNGSLREDRSTWTGNISFSRAPRLQSEVTAAGTVLGLANTNAAAVNGGYTYQLTERWSLGATAGGNGNRYEQVLGSGGSLQNNQGYYAGGNVGYAYSERTQFNVLAVYSHYSSDVTRGDYVTTTLGVVHKFSPRLTVSASVGGFWSDITATQTALVCPTTPILCESGLVPRIPITTGEQRRDSGELYGGSISYAFSERTQLSASLAENLAPSGTGTLTKTDSAIAYLSHRISDRTIGRLGLSYARQTFPTGLSRSSTTNNYAGEIGFSYMLAERWTLDAGYRYRRADYSQNSSEPQSNVVFVSIGYGWPGSSFTDWVGTRLDTQGLAGAGPVSLSERTPIAVGTGTTSGTSESEVAPGATPAPASLETSPFDQFTIP